VKTDDIKLVFDFEHLASKGVDSMPTWKDDYLFTVPEGKFRLITGRHAQFTQSATTNNMMLRDLIDTNYLWINRRVAEKKGIKFGDMLEVKSRVGKVTIKAYPTEKIAPNQVFMIHGFGGMSRDMTMAYGNGGSDAVLLEDIHEPVYGAAVMHETNVELKKI
jgi:thiosulfate reductase/polysulfide reductase chain A